MMITFVNGFLCTCSCDVSKAKRGVDPHQQTDGAQNTAKPDAMNNGAIATDKNAVVFGGALSATSANTNFAAVQSSGPTSIQIQSRTIDLLV